MDIPLKNIVRKLKILIAKRVEFMFILVSIREITAGIKCASGG
jgi:hypothetical protein